MARKKIDSRVRTLIENCVKTRQRSLFVVVGDRNRNQIVNLHYILSKSQVKARPSVLWCYKHDLGFSSNRRKRMREIRKKVKSGLVNPDSDDPFELFVTSTDIRYCYYKDTHKILGNTYGMVILQDFEALTPNLLARTIETVEGGGMVLILLKTMSSLKQLQSMTMDVHARYRTDEHRNVVARFNERFLLSLASCPTCIVVDDELTVLPISSHIRNIKPIGRRRSDGDADGADDAGEDEAVPASAGLGGYASLEQVPEELRGDFARHKELADVKASLVDEQPVGSLVELTRTVDQARALLVFVEAISEKTLRSTVTLTAARGRGKSAALGLAIAGAVAYGYSNIFVTSPSPENLRTLFDFIFKGLDALGYKETTDYSIRTSQVAEEYATVVRVNIFRDHRQTIQYILPSDSDKLGQAELLVIDEAAAIPITHVTKLLGNYLVFLASTINGYEGTGRSLSLKLFKRLREQAQTQVVSESSATAVSAAGRALNQVTLVEPIRYAPGDPVEAWLHTLLCLDVETVPRLLARTPHPSECELYHVNRDTLFSFHKASEAFLQRMMALYVSSHYKNTPDDLQLMSDAPAHHLFVLLPPVDPAQTTLPEILCVVQVALEGHISRESMARSLARGQRGSGDLIPWTVAQQYQDNDFTALSGARVVRIATHPDYARMGYGTRALDLLARYYQGELMSDDTAPPVPERGVAEHEDEGAETDDAGTGAGASASASASAEAAEAADSARRLQSELVTPRANLPPLLEEISKRSPERLHYIGVSYGVTQQLFNFWKRASYVPVYVRQTANEMTGEHTCIMIRPLKSDDLDTVLASDWLVSYYADFRRRFSALLAYEFSQLTVHLSLSILDAPAVIKPQLPVTPLTVGEMNQLLTPYDHKRMQAYVSNLVDYHVVMDIVPTLARLYFTGRLPIGMPATYEAILLSLGLAHKSVDSLAETFKLPASQVLALFNKTMRKMERFLSSLVEADAARSLPSVAAQPRSGQTIGGMIEQDAVDDLLGDLNDTGDSAARAAAVLADPELQQYAVTGLDEDWQTTLRSVGENVPRSISIKREPGSKKRTREEMAAAEAAALRTKEDDDSRSKKKHKSNAGGASAGGAGGGKKWRK